MRLVHFGPEQGREIADFGSVGFLHNRLLHVRGETRVDIARLAAGGRIGRHPARSAQAFAVVSGDGTVSGGDGAEHSIEAGVAAVWDPGEEHETRTDFGLVAVIVQADAFELLAE